MNLNCANCRVGLEVEESAAAEPFNCPSCGEFNDAPMSARAPSGVRLSNGSGMRGGAPAGPSRRGSGGNVGAAIASFVIPGLGQLSQGRLTPALFLFLLALCFGIVGGMFLSFPMIIIPSGVVALGAAAEAAVWDGIG